MSAMKWAVVAGLLLLIVVVLWLASALESPTMPTDESTLGDPNCAPVGRSVRDAERCRSRVEDLPPIPPPPSICKGC
jgi:hypothetical protein